MTETAPLAPGATIGVLGGGQLGRMLALAAARLGMKTHIYCPDPQSPAFDVTPLKTVAAYDDSAALEAFARAVDVVTYEFENVPVATAELLARHVPVAPGPQALRVSQDRLAEKRFLNGNGIDVAPHQKVDNLAELDAAIAAIGLPAILKTRRMGYDGKGQRTIRSDADAAPALEALGGSDLILEGFVPFAREISVIVARNGKGEAKSFDPAENVHENHILATSTVPAHIGTGTADRAREIAEAIATALGYVGVLGVEFFVVEQGGAERLVVNEIAPRVHNSGHWTEAVCVTDQFEQHIRAILNWPLGDTRRMADVVMHNLIGDAVYSVTDALGEGAQPNLYGKAEARPGRKMGHLNRVRLQTPRFFV